MKKLYYTVALTGMLFLFSGIIQAQTENKAVNYMNELSTSTEALKNETWQYLKAITRGKSARKVEKKREVLINGLRAMKSEVNSKQEFTENCAYKKAVVDYLDMSYTVLKEDFDKILDMEDIAEQSFDLMEAYLTAKEMASEKLDKAFEELQKAQEVFAAENNITLIQAELDSKSQKIQNASQALEYYNDIFLVFFKSYKQEVYILDAYGRSDVNALDQNIHTMIEFNKEGLQKLDELDNYNGDASLKIAARQMLKYYDEEAALHFPKMVDFFMSKDNFEKLSKVMETTKKKDLTEEDIKNYNTAVETFNKAVNEANEVNKTMNKLRAKHLESWNNQIEDYFARHAD
jgi:hypothetical protein